MLLTDAGYERAGDVFFQQMIVVAYTCWGPWHVVAAQSVTKRTMITRKPHKFGETSLVVLIHFGWLIQLLFDSAK